MWQSTTPIYEFKKKHVVYPDQPQFAKFAKENCGISDLAQFYTLR